MSHSGTIHIALYVLELIIDKVIKLLRIFLTQTQVLNQELTNHVLKFLLITLTKLSLIINQFAFVRVGIDYLATHLQVGNLLLHLLIVGRSLSYGWMEQSQSQSK